MSRRYEFAHTLRGIAALSVLAAHYCGAFFQYHEYLATLMQVPALERVPDIYGVAWMIGEFYVLLSQFGVGIFFIISGFVIPFALMKEDQSMFIKRRVFRIFPVYIAGFTFVATAIFALTVYAGSKFGYSLLHLVSHFGILTRGLLGYSRIDGISWTLEIELVFYLVMAVAGHRIMAHGLRAPILAALVIAAFAIASNVAMRLGFYSIVGNTGFQAWAALLLVVGIGYHLFLTGKLSRKSFCELHAAVAALVIAVWLCFDRTVYTWQWIGGYAVAMAVFAIAYAMRDRVKSFWLTSHLANISYPLYVVHALLGYVVMYWVISQGYGAYTAILAAATVSYVVAVVLHLAVEKPCQAYRLPRRPAHAGRFISRSR